MHGGRNETGLDASKGTCFAARVTSPFAGPHRETARVDQTATRAVLIWPAGYPRPRDARHALDLLGRTPAWPRDGSRGRRAGDRVPADGCHGRGWRHLGRTCRADV